MEDIAQIHTHGIYKGDVSTAKMASLTQNQHFFSLDRPRSSRVDYTRYKLTIRLHNNSQTTRKSNSTSSISPPIDSITRAMASTTLNQSGGRGGGRGRGRARGRGGRAGGNTGNSDRNDQKSKGRATQTVPAEHLLHDSEPVAMDIEFQNYKRNGLNRHRVGRVAIVSIRGETVLDVFAAYANEDGVTKFLPPRSLHLGVAYADLKFDNGAVPAQKVENWVQNIVRDRTVILFAAKGDREAFYHLGSDVFSRSKIIDMQVEYSYLQNSGPPKLRLAAERILGRMIQTGDHSPVEDAAAAMDLFLVSPKWDSKTKKVVDTSSWDSLPACEECGERSGCSCHKSDASEDTAFETVSPPGTQPDEDGW